MLGALPFRSTRNLFGAWNQILPLLLIGSSSKWIFRCSWKSACMLCAAARFSRMRSSSILTSAGDNVSAFTLLVYEARRNRKTTALRMFQFEVLLCSLGLIATTAG